MTEYIKIRCDDCKFVEDCVDYGWEGCRKFTPKLKRCPFCGGEARIDKLYENEWYVYCPKCERHYDTKQEAIENWNKRVVAE